MIFLGQASNYSPSDIFYHTFAYGNMDHIDELRAFLAARYGSTKDHVAVYHNGRSALAVGIKSTVPRGSKIIINASTCYAVVEAVRAAGCVPVYADINKETLHFGKAELEKALAGESDVRAVVVQNNLGIPCDIAGIEAVAKAHKLVIIEDLAHSAGIKYKDGREAGTVGRVVALSFGKGKAIDTISGGAVVLTDQHDTPLAQPEIKPKLGDRLADRWYPFIGSIIRTGYRINKNFGKKLTAAFVKSNMIHRSADAKLDTNQRITCWQAQLALRQLRQMPRRGRAPIRRHYLVNNRDELLARLEEIGVILSDIWYTTPVAPERYFEQADFHPEACPVATQVAEQIINLPAYYRNSDLKPALKLISEYLVEKADLETEEDPIVQLATALASEGDIPDLREEIAEALENHKIVDRSQENAEAASIEQMMNGKEPIADAPAIDKKAFKTGFLKFKKKITDTAETVKEVHEKTKKRSLEQKLRDAEDQLEETGVPKIKQKNIKDKISEKLNEAKKVREARKAEDAKLAEVKNQMLEQSDFMTDKMMEGNEFMNAISDASDVAPIPAAPAPQAAPKPVASAPQPVQKPAPKPVAKPAPKPAAKPAESKPAPKTFRAPKVEKPQRPVAPKSSGGMPGMRQTAPKAPSKEELKKQIMEKQKKGGVL